MFKVSAILASVAMLSVAGCAGNTNAENALIGAGACGAGAMVAGADNRDTALAAAGCAAGGALANDTGLSF